MHRAEQIAGIVARVLLRFRQVAPGTSRPGFYFGIKIPHFCIDPGRVILRKIVASPPGVYQRILRFPCTCDRRHYMPKPLNLNLLTELIPLPPPTRTTALNQLLDMLPRLDEGGSECEGGLQGRAIDLVRHLGSHSINVAQLKKVFRLLQPLPATSTKRAGASFTSTTASISPLQPPWMCCLLGALRGMMGDDPGPQRFFLFNGLNSGLRLPRMPRWPAKKGYTFCAWVRLEEGPASSSSAESWSGGVGSGNRTTPAAEAPCLFSFCGEQRGQGVAACFIPLRKKRRSVQRGVAAPETTPDADTRQHYALELRVGTGRKKPPAIVRFPSVVVTAGEWIFVAVAHAASRWGQRGEASVLVDSCWCTSASPFPRFGEGGVATSSIACHHPRQAKNATGDCSTETEEGAGAKVTGRPVLCSLRGQVRILRGCLDRSVICRGGQLRGSAGLHSVVPGFPDGLARPGLEESARVMYVMYSAGFV